MTPIDAPDAWTLTRAASRFSRMAARVVPNSYSTVAWRVLADLEPSAGLRVGDLADAHRVSQPTMTGLLRRLDAEGWVRRDPDPEDGRVTRVRITTAGAQELQDYHARVRAGVQPRLDSLSPDDRAVLARASELLLELADEDA